MMRFVQSYARAHAHAYPHTPTRTRTHTGSSLSKGPASLRPCPAGSALWRLRCPTTRSPSRMSRPARLKWAAAEVRARDARACKADRAFCGGCPCRLCPRRCENVWGCAPFLKALGTHCISRSSTSPQLASHIRQPRLCLRGCRPRVTRTPMDTGNKVACSAHGMGIEIFAVDAVSDESLGVDRLVESLSLMPAIFLSRSRPRRRRAGAARYVRRRPCATARPGRPRPQHDLPHCL